MKMCSECRAKQYAYDRRYFINNRDKINEQQRKRDKLKRQKAIENGMCSNCYIRKSKDGYKQCPKCIERKKAVKYKMNYGKVTKRQYREKNNLCFFCDNPRVDGLKVCAEHQRILKERSNSEKCKQARNQLIKNGILY